MCVHVHMHVSFWRQCYHKAEGQLLLPAQAAAAAACIKLHAIQSSHATIQPHHLSHCTQIPSVQHAAYLSHNPAPRSYLNMLQSGSDAHHHWHALPEVTLVLLGSTQYSTIVASKAWQLPGNLGAAAAQSSSSSGLLGCPQAPYGMHSTTRMPGVGICACPTCASEHPCYLWQAATDRSDVPHSN